MISKLPIVDSYFKIISKSIGSYGLQETLKKEFKKSKTKILVYGLEDNLLEILKSKPVIMVGNHSAELEPTFVIASLPKREIFFLIINSLYLGIIPNLDKYFIPVYIRHNFKKSKSKLDSFMLKIIDRFNPTPHLDLKAEHEMNIKNINLAGKKVKEGGMVLIYPENHLDPKIWYPGVAHIIKEAGSLEDGYFVKTFVSGASSLDLLRTLPFLGIFLPKIKVYFAKPQKISEIYREDPKRLTIELADDYNSWVSQLNSSLAA